MTPEAQRLAEECKRLMAHYCRAILNYSGSATEQNVKAVVGVGEAVHAAIDKLASLIPAGGLAEEAQTIPLSAIRPIAVEAIRAITGCPDLLSGKRSLVDEMESVSQAAAKTFAALSAPTHQQEQPR